MLEATILDLHAGIVKPADFSSVKSILRLNEDSLPLIIVPVGEWVIIEILEPKKRYKLKIQKI